MSASSTTGRFWICPLCRKHVPDRLDSCRCGFSQADSDLQIERVSTGQADGAAKTPDAAQPSAEPEARHTGSTDRAIKSWMIGVATIAFSGFALLAVLTTTRTSRTPPASPTTLAPSPPPRPGATEPSPSNGTMIRVPRDLIADLESEVRQLRLENEALAREGERKNRLLKEVAGLARIDREIANRALEELTRSAAGRTSAERVRSGESRRAATSTAEEALRALMPTPIPVPVRPALPTPVPFKVCPGYRKCALHGRLSRSSSFHSGIDGRLFSRYCHSTNRRGQQHCFEAPC